MAITEQSGFGIQPPELDALERRIVTEHMPVRVASVLQGAIDERKTYLQAQQNSC